MWKWKKRYDRYNPATWDDARWAKAESMIRNAMRKGLETERAPEVQAELEKLSNYAIDSEEGIRHAKVVVSLMIKAVKSGEQDEELMIAFCDKLDAFEG